MGHKSRSRKDSGDSRNVDYDGPGQEVSEKENIGRWPRYYFCDILVKNMAGFYPCLKSQPEVRMRSFVLTVLAEDISKEPSIDYVLWFFVATLM